MVGFLDPVVTHFKQETYLRPIGGFCDFGGIITGLIPRCFGKH
jgi:hypothetical protein